MKNIFIAIALLFALTVSGQTEVEVTYVEGLAFKNLTTTQLNNITTKEVGDTYFDVTKGNPVYWTGSDWRDLTGGGLSPGDQTKLNFITVTQNVDLDDIESKANSALQLYTETDPTVTPSSIKTDLETLTGNNRLSASAIRDISANEADPVFSASEAASITATNKANWNSAFGWGDWGVGVDQSFIEGLGFTVGGTAGADWDTNLTNIPADIADGDNDTQLTPTEVVAAVDSEYPNLDTDGTDDATLPDNNTYTGDNIFEGKIQIEGFNPRLEIAPLSDANIGDASHGGIYFGTDGNFRVYNPTGTGGNVNNITFDNLNYTAPRTLILPDISGTLLLDNTYPNIDTDGNNDVTLAGNQTISGLKEHTSDIIMGNATSVQFRDLSSNDLQRYDLSAQGIGFRISPQVRPTTGDIYSTYDIFGFNGTNLKWEIDNSPIITAANAAANGIGTGSGTDDQTALEVPFTPNGSIAATNVQDAIEEVRNEAGGGIPDDNSVNSAKIINGSIVSEDLDFEVAPSTGDLVSINAGGNFTVVDPSTLGITANQAQSIANTGLKFFRTVTDGESTALGHVRIVTDASADYGKAVINKHTLATEITVTLDADIPDGGVISYYNQNADGTINFLPDTGFTINGFSDRKAVNDTTAFSGFIRDGTNFISLGGNELVQVINHIFPQDNAASVADINSIGSFSPTPPGILTVDTVTVHDGTYSLAVTSDVSSPYADITISGVTAGVSTTVTWWGYEGDTNAFSYGRVLSSDIQGDPGNATTTLDGALWAQYTLTFVPASTSFAFRIGNGGSTLNLTSYFDLISISQTP